jgi:3D (Asp-Asp-Asp) domain-containing protein
MMSGLFLAVLGVAPGLGEWEPVVMDVSAYCPCSLCCGLNASGITASGKPVVGKLIAAPSSYLFGTEMRVPGYGVAKVQDRGGAIKSAGDWVRNVKIGNQKVADTRLQNDRIDLLFPTHEEALKWGRQKLVVSVKRSDR